MATLASSPIGHNFESDCKVIHGARLGELVQAVGRRSQAERRVISDTYKALYGEDVIDHLHDVEVKIGQRGRESNFSIRACRALSLWMVDPHVRDAMFAREELALNEPNYMAIVEILVGRKSSHVLMIKQAYHARFKSHLDHDVVSIDPPHLCQRVTTNSFHHMHMSISSKFVALLQILVALSTSHKAHQVDISQDIAKSDAIRLFQTGERSSAGSVDEAVALEILSKRSIAQLRLTFSWYRRIYGHSYNKPLKIQRSSQFAEALRLVVKCIYDPPKYYAKMIHASIKAESSDNKGSRSLERLMMSRAEVDMDEIQKVYMRKYGVELRDSICQSIACGDYRDFLLALTKAS